MRFIVFDGVEGCGKSTQLMRVSEAMRAAGGAPVLTHEPGGTPIGEVIRSLLLSPEHGEMAPLTEVLLFCASRAQHVREVIAPALGEGRVVLCDRFDAATFAYQGHAGGVGADLVERVNAAATEGLAPDLTVILDLDPAEGLLRKFGGEAVADAADRIERNAPAFHELVREGFLLYAERHAERCVVVDAARSPDEVFADIAALLEL
ncbi:MAG: dTMP kinase [Armatimonadetes bacterium]|nr:dTMP kinase [Armatimonadota bacterium]